MPTPRGVLWIVRYEDREYGRISQAEYATEAEVRAFADAVAWVNDSTIHPVYLGPADKAPLCEEADLIAGSL